MKIYLIYFIFILLRTEKKLLEERRIESFPFQNSPNNNACSLSKLSTTELSDPSITCVACRKHNTLTKNQCLKGPDSVEKVADFVVLELWSRAPAQPFQTGFGTILASFLRFWAVAAIWNCSVAPFGPRRRIIVIPIYRFRWANSISTLLR